MKVALLGAGRIGTFHATTLTAHPDVETLIVADVDEARAAAVAQQVGGQAMSIDAAIGSRPDAVVIAAATSAHASLITACLDAGLPTFCEKPIALTWEDSLAIVDRVEQQSGVLQIGFQRRFDPGYAEAKRMREQGELGTLYSVRIAGHDPAPPHEEYIPASGGIFRDLHIHDFDILRWVTGGEVEEIYALGTVRAFEQFARYGDVDTSAAVLQMADGVLVAMTGGRHDPRGYDIRMELFGSRESIAVGLDAHTPLRSVEPGVPPPSEPGYRDFTVRFGHAYRAELAHFLELARGRAQNPCTGRDALEALRIAIAADRSRAEHRPVRVAEIR